MRDPFPGGGVSDNGVEISEAEEFDEKIQSDEFALPNAPKALCAYNNAHSINNNIGVNDNTTLALQGA
jgi:hypothetical protein